MMFQRQPLTIAIIAASLGLAACNSNDHDTASSSSVTTTITVTPSLGKILSGRVVLRDAKTGVDLAPAKTLTPADNGTASFTVPIAKLAEPVIAAVLPNLQGKIEYADEANLSQAATITVPTADINKPILRAAATLTANANLGVTALTEAAVQQAEKAAGGLIAQNINTANAAVKNQLNLNFDITQAPIVVGLGEFDKLVNAALDAQRRAYAAYLATLAKEAQRINSSSTTPAYDMAKVFASDLSDGVFDAKQGTTALSFYNANFINAWVNWVQNFYTSFAQLANIVALNRWYGGFDIANKDSVKSFPDAVPIRTVDGIEEYACSGEGRIKSSSGTSIYMDFVNQRGSNVNVYWLDYNTGRVSYRPNLATGQTHNQQTFVTHPWLVTNNSGACIGIYRPVSASNKTITFKANEVVLAGATAPVETGNPDTCVSLGAGSSSLTAIADFVGTYDVMASNVASTFQVAANGDISLKGQASLLKEVCVNPVQNNGQGYRLITQKATVLLFKDTANVISAEGKDYTNTTSTDYFSGNKKTVIDPLKPIRTTNGVQEYTCDSWTKIANGVADGTPTISFVNNLGANTSLTLFGLNSIQRTTTLFTGIQNGATRQQTALKNQFVKVETAGGDCLGVFKSTTNDDKTITFKPTGLDISNTVANTTLAASGTATGKITNVQFNKNGTATGGTGEVRANAYEFLGDLNTAYTLKVNDTIQSLRYELASINGKFTSVNLYSGANSATPLFVYTCDTAGDNTCLDKVSFSQGATPTLVFNNMKMRGVYQPQFDAIINGQVKLNP